MNFLNKSNEFIKGFLSKYSFFILIYIFVFVLFFFLNPIQTIEERTIDSNDEWVFFRMARQLKETGINGLLFLNWKYILNSIFINISWITSDVLKLPDLFIYSSIKVFFHVISFPLFYKIINYNYSKLVALVTSLIYFFDPYLLSFKYILNRDDLIISFSIIFIYIYINLLKKIDLNIIFIFIISYFSLQGLRPLQSFSLLLLVPLVYKYFAFDKYFISLKYFSNFSKDFAQHNKQILIN